MFLPLPPSRVTGFDTTACTILDFGGCFIFQLSSHLSSYVCHCPLAEGMLPLILFSLFPCLPSLGNFTTDYIQFSNVPCADNSLISFPPIKLTSLSSNQSSAHSSARSLLMSSYQFTLHASQHRSFFSLANLSIYFLSS